ncbi:MAG TPA: O-antigen ligase family protein [Terracidiphilus sp.]|nr:O-antigen ligase family protein [Terracidiphilus sp.]
MNRAQSDEQPIWHTAVMPALLLCLVKFAGVTLLTDQDISVGDRFVATTSGSSSTAIEGAFAYLTALILIIIMAPRVRLITEGLKSNWLLLSLPLLAAVSSVWSVDPFDSLRKSIWLLLSTCFAIWMIECLSMERQMQLLIVTGFFCALLSVVAIVVWPQVGLDRLHEDAWQGVFTSKNHLGRIFLFLLLPGLHYPLSARGARWIKWPYVVLMLSMIAMSRSRTAWLLTAVYLVFVVSIGPVMRTARRDRNLSLISVGLLLCLVSVIALANLDSVLGAVGGDSTLNGRTVLWPALIRSVNKKPLLGYGYQAFWAPGSGEATNAMIRIYTTMRFFASYAHSGYLAVLLDNGWLGMGLVALIAIRGMRDGLARMLSAQDKSESWYLGIILLSVLYNIDEVTFMLPSYLPWVMFLLASASLHGMSKQATNVTFEPVTNCA